MPRAIEKIKHSVFLKSEAIDYLATKECMGEIRKRLLEQRE